MAQCKHYKICGREADESSDEELCILHSKNLDKARDDFRQALEDHRTRKSCDFSYFVFPEYAGFRKTKFSEWASFFHVKFAESADFEDAKFFEGVSFSHAKFPEGAKFFATEFKKLTNFADAKFGKETDFSGDADFRVAKFEGRVSFADASFNGPSSFGDAEFMMEADFYNATFEHLGAFARVTFSGITDFSCATFKKGAEFSRARFLSRTLFASNQAKGLTIPSFSGVEIDFREAIIAPLDALVIRDADLTQCRFLGTDLRKAEITGAEWPEIGERSGVYDEVAPLRGNKDREWHHIERLYRELKQNYEDRRDYERARHFHYGEKEARRKQSTPFSGLWLWLNLYKWVAGYGERYWRPLLWAVGLMVVSAGLYLCLGLRPKTGDSTFLNITSPWDWLRSGFYSLRVMTLLKPEDLETYRYAKLVYAFESLAGPVLIGLFALALRQRLKR